MKQNALPTTEAQGPLICIKRLLNAFLETQGGKP